MGSPFCEDIELLGATANGLIKKKSILENSIWHLAGRVIYSACQWGILVALAKIGNTKMVGVFGLGLAISAPIMALTSMNLQSVFASDVKNDGAFQEYFVFRVFSCLLGLGAILIIAFFSCSSFEGYMAIFMIGAAKAFENISDVVYGVFLKHERLDFIAKSVTLKGILSLAGVAIALYFTKSLIISLLTLAVLWAGLLFFYDLRRAGIFTVIGLDIFKNLKFRSLQTILWVGLPLGLAAALNSLYTNIPRYFIEKFVGTEALGYFVAITYIIVLGDNLTNTIGQATIAPMAQYFERGSKRFLTLLLRLVGSGFLIGVLGTIIAMLWGDTILTTIYTSEYAKFNSVFVMIMIAGIAMYSVSFLIYAMIVIRLVNIQTILSGALVLVTLFLSWILIPRYGLMGAAYTMVITYWFRLVLHGGAFFTGVHFYKFKESKIV